MFSLFLTPLFTFLIAGTIAICVLQPLGGFLSDCIGTAATSAIGSGGAVTGFILGGTFLPMVMLGIHQTLTPIHAELLARYGVTILLPVLAMAGAGQVGASFAVYCKTKNRFLKKTIASALPVGIMGVGEPLIYGVTLPLGKPFIGACIGGACGGAVQAQFMVGAATLGISGLPLAAATDQIPVYLLGLVTATSAASSRRGSSASTTRPRNHDERTPKNQKAERKFYMENGISLYPGLDNTPDENLALLEKAAQAGIRRVFTSLHIPETDVAALKQEIGSLLRAARRHHMEVISDVSPATCKLLDLPEFNPASFRMLGITTLRLDYGFSAEEMARLTHRFPEMRFQLNASTITNRILKDLQDAGTDFSHIDALHNFYPRRGTGPQ